MSCTVLLYITLHSYHIIILNYFELDRNVNRGLIVRYIIDKEL